MQPHAAATRIADTARTPPAVERPLEAAPLTPEMRLLAAMLEQAAGDLAACPGARDPIGRRLYREAWQWVMAADRRHPFSFVNACEILGYGPAVVRRQFLRATAAPEELSGGGRPARIPRRYR